MTRPLRSSVGRAAVIATVLVVSVGAAVTAVATTERTAPTMAAAGQPAAERGARANVAPEIDMQVYQACIDPSVPYLRTGPASMYLAGYSNAAKLGSAAGMGFGDVDVEDGDPAFGDLALARSIGEDEGLYVGGAVTVGADNYSCARATFHLDHAGRREFAPMRATFLAFGFMPVTATVHLEQTGPLLRQQCGTVPGCRPITAVAYAHLAGPSALREAYRVAAVAHLRMRLSDVVVNGAPLDVGDRCQTDGTLTSDNPIDPTAVVLTGENALAAEGLDGLRPYYGAILLGGASAGTVTIPPFTGCRSARGEDLDALMTATVSGPGNYVQLIQGPMCSNVATYCVGPLTDQLPLFAPLWKVSGGGTFTGSSSGMFRLNVQGGGVMTCAQSTVTLTVPDRGSRPLRADLGTITWGSVGDCTAPQNNTWTVQGHGVIDGVQTAAGTAEGYVSVELELTRSTGTPCTVIAVGTLVYSYANPPSSTLTLATVNSTGVIAGTLGAKSSTCETVPRDAAVRLVTPVEYPISPGTLTIEQRIEG